MLIIIPLLYRIEQWADAEQSEPVKEGARTQASPGCPPDEGSGLDTMR